MTEVTLRIDGMHCGACIRRVTQSLQAVAGAEVEEVRLGAARVKIPASTRAESTESLLAGLRKAGFSAQEDN